VTPNGTAFNHIRFAIIREIAHVDCHEHPRQGPQGLIQTSITSFSPANLPAKQNPPVDTSASIC